MSLPENVNNIYTFLKQRSFPAKVDAAVILGSGLGGFENRLKDLKSIAYSEIDNFPTTTVAGHNGTLNIGNLGNKKVLVFAGRFHHYEGHSIKKTILPVQLTKAFDAPNLFISNAAGGINYRFRVGDLMLIDDVMRLGMSYSPKGPADDFRYSNDHLIKKALDIAKDLKIPVRQGTYLYVKGPSYETKAEIRAFRIIGADAVGMSTAPELLEAARLGIQSLGISLISNMATGINSKKLEHSEIKEIAAQRTVDFSNLMEELIIKL